MTDCERTTAYLDGELPDAEHAAVIAHLATCARCQADAADFVGLEVAMSSGRAAAMPAPRRRWVWLAAGAALAVAAVIAIVTLRPRGRGAAPIALAETRPIEVRFTAAPFDRHRPYRVARGDADRELLPLEVLAGLERRGDRGGLAAAHVLAGEPTRARATLEAAAPSPARDSDLAAVALAAGDAAGALDDADRALRGAPDLAPAHWNRALALRALDLPLAAAAELDAVAARGEPGWADEARERARALRTSFGRARGEGAAFQTAGRAMIAGTGRLLDAEAVRHHPGPARLHFFDALRVATTADEARALAPLAAELDRAAGTDHARRAIDRIVAGSDPALRRRFQPRYRGFVAGELDDAAADALEADLRGAGAAVDDLWLGVVVLRNRLGRDREHAAAVIAAMDDPWFSLLLEREDARAVAAAGDPFAAERRLAAAAAGCDARAWALRCGGLEEGLALVEQQLGRIDEAAGHAARARTLYALAGAPSHDDRMLGSIANLDWLRGRSSAALAWLDEYRRRAITCAQALFADDLTAIVSVAAGDLAGARASLPEAGRCDAGVEPARLVTAVALARLGDAADRARADALVAAAVATQPALADLAAGRLAIDRDPAGGGARVRAAMTAIAGEIADPRTAAELRTWGWATLISDAGRRGDWSAALAAFEEELGRPAPARCVVGVSSDDERSVAVARGADGTLRGAYRADRPLGLIDAATIVPSDLVATLAGCPSIAVIARPPLHGSAALLPAELPWSFVGPGHRGASDLPARALIVDDARPPASLGLPALRPAVLPAGATRVSGVEATPARVRAALRDATYVELHAHGIVDVDELDTSFLALSPDPDGSYALTAAAVRETPLRGAPVVVLAACRTARVAPQLHRRWSLPDAFLAAGARAVIATADVVPDDEVPAILAALRERLGRGETPAQAIAAIRATASRTGAAWLASWMVFE